MESNEVARIDNRRRELLEDLVAHALEVNRDLARAVDKADPMGALEGAWLLFEISATTLKLALKLGLRGRAIVAKTLLDRARAIGHGPRIRWPE
jgi:hypothetical protein